jgi:hypothetical protein
MFPSLHKIWNIQFRIKHYVTQRRCLKVVNFTSLLQIFLLFRRESLTQELVNLVDCPVIFSISCMIGCVLIINFVNIVLLIRFIQSQKFFYMLVISYKSDDGQQMGRNIVTKWVVYVDMVCSLPGNLKSVTGIVTEVQEMRLDETLVAFRQWIAAQ